MSRLVELLSYFGTTSIRSHKKVMCYLFKKKLESPKEEIEYISLDDLIKKISEINFQDPEYNSRIVLSAEGYGSNSILSSNMSLPGSLNEVVRARLKAIMSDRVLVDYRMIKKDALFKSHLRYKEKVIWRYLVNTGAID